MKTNVHQNRSHGEWIWLLFIMNFDNQFSHSRSKLYLFIYLFFIRTFGQDILNILMNLRCKEQNCCGLPIWRNSRNECVKRFFCCSPIFVRSRKLQRHQSIQPMRVNVEKRTGLYLVLSQLLAISHMLLNRNIYNQNAIKPTSFQNVLLNCVAIVVSMAVLVCV